MKVKCQLMRFKLHIEMTYVNYSVGNFLENLYVRIWASEIVF